MLVALNLLTVSLTTKVEKTKLTDQRSLIEGGWHSTEVAFALPTQPTRVRVSVFPKFFPRYYSWKNSFDVAELIDGPA